MAQINFKQLQNAYKIFNHFSIKLMYKEGPY